MLNEIIDRTLMRMCIVRLNDLRIDGSFLCPRCNNVISHEDTQEIDSTVESVIFDGKSEELAIVLLCNKCGLRILLDLARASLSASFNKLNCFAKLFASIEKTIR